MGESLTPIAAPVGVDVHKRCCKVVELDHGDLKVRKSMANTREDWLEMLKCVFSAISQNYVRIRESEQKSA